MENLKGSLFWETTALMKVAEKTVPREMNYEEKDIKTEEKWESN